MSSPAKASHEPVTSTDMLVAYMASGMKPASQWRIGTEHEKFAFTIPGHRPAPYGGENGIRALLEGMRQFGWEPVVEAGNIIGLVKGDANVSLEPGASDLLLKSGGEIPYTQNATVLERLIGRVVQSLGDGS